MTPTMMRLMGFDQRMDIWRRQGRYDGMPDEVVLDLLGFVDMTGRKEGDMGERTVCGFPVLETEVGGGYEDAVTLSLDGNEWAALLGSNLQEGIAGFGNTQQAALDAFVAEYLRERGT